MDFTNKEKQTRNKNKFFVSGYERTEKGFGLKLGTLFRSEGNIEEITKNIVHQLEKRMKELPITQYVGSVKFCVPFFNEYTEQAITESITKIFSNKKFELYISKKDLDTSIFFVKIILNDAEVLKETTNIQILKLSTGSPSNIEKNIRSQISKISELYVIDSLVVPKYNLKTKSSLENVLKEKFPNNKYCIYKMVTKNYLVLL